MDHSSDPESEEGDICEDCGGILRQFKPVYCDSVAVLLPTDIALMHQQGCFTRNTEFAVLGDVLSLPRTPTDGKPRHPVEFSDKYHPWN